MPTEAGRSASPRSAAAHAGPRSVLVVVAGAAWPVRRPSAHCRTPRAAPPRSTAWSPTSLSTEQAENAAMIAAVGVTPRTAGAGRVDRARHGVPGVARSTTSTTATATRSACSSSARPRAGARAEQIRDPYYATNKFYDELEKVDGYADMRITEAAQQVQRSGFPEAYEDHAADGRALASALTGYSEATRSPASHVRPRAASTPRTEPTTGLTPRAARPSGGTSSRPSGRRRSAGSPPAG